MKQLTIFDSIEPEPARRRQASGRSANPIIFNDYESYIKKFEVKKTTDDTYTPRDVFEAVLQYVGEIYDLEGKQILRPFYPGGDYERAEYPADGVVIDNPPFSIFKKVVTFFVEKKIPFFLFGPGITILNVFKYCSIVVISPDIRFENGAKIRCNFATNLFTEKRATTACRLSYLINSCKSQQNANSVKKYDYPAEVLSISDLQTIAGGDVDFKVTEKETVIIEHLAGRKLFGPHLLIGFKNAIRKLELKKRIKKKAQKARIVVKLPEQERRRASMLDC